MRFSHNFYNWDRAWDDNLDLQLRLTKETGWEGFEGKISRMGVPAEVLREKCETIGVTCAAIAGGIKEAIDYAHVVGADVVRSGVSKEECARWVEYAGERDILITAHNHLSVKGRGKGAVETREELLRYIDVRPGIYACPDTGHLMLCGSDPIQTIRDLGERCAYIHLKDIDPAAVGKADSGGSSFWELGTGALDLPDAMKTLEEIGFDGWVTVERDCRVEDYAQSARNMRQTLRDMGY